MLGVSTGGLVGCLYTTLPLGCTYTAKRRFAFCGVRRMWQQHFPRGLRQRCSTARPALVVQCFLGCTYTGKSASRREIRLLCLFLLGHETHSARKSGKAKTPEAAKNVFSMHVRRNVREKQCLLFVDRFRRSRKKDSQTPQMPLFLMETSTRFCCCCARNKFNIRKAFRFPAEILHQTHFFDTMTRALSQQVLKMLLLDAAV